MLPIKADFNKPYSDGHNKVAHYSPLGGMRLSDVCAVKRRLTPSFCRQNGHALPSHPPHV
eukprot:scaffold576_cov260-Pinguiococcus_pyrenoidosus.AAC.84